MRHAIFGIPWIPKSLVEAFLKTKWEFHDYLAEKDESEILKFNPEVLIAFKPPEKFISNEKIKYIITPGAGVDGIPMEKIRERGQILINCHANSVSVAEHAWGLLLACSRKITKYDERIRNEEKWPNGSQVRDLNTDLFSKTLGILGYGPIGRQLEAYGVTFGMEVQIFRKNPDEDQFFTEELLDQIEDLDVLIVACPLTNETRNFIDKELISKAASHIIIINIARGEIIDEDALFNALREGEIRSAGLDVWKNSPHIGGEGAEPKDFSFIPNLVISPHRAWVSKESYAKVAEAIANELDNISKGKASDNIVNLELGY